MAGGSITNVDLYAFGNRASPRPPRPDADIILDADGMIGPEAGDFPAGASTFAETSGLPLGGHLHKLAAGTPLPAGLGFRADGRDAQPRSTHAATHHTIFPAFRMSYDLFVALYLSWPRSYAGKK